MMKWTSYLCLIQRNDKMEPRLNCKQPRSFDIYLALTLIKNLQTYEIQDNLKKQTAKEGESSYVPMVSIETKYQTRSEQILTCCSKHPNGSIRL